jgi:Tol biopolymer transport system component
VEDFRWSPDGDALVYREGGSLYIVNADGSDNHPLALADRISYYRAADWSPDGDRIAAIRDFEDGSDDGVEQIIDMRTDGSGKRVLASESFTNEVDPELSKNLRFSGITYSRDGGRLAFAREWEIVTPTPGPDG